MVFIAATKLDYFYEILTKKLDIFVNVLFYYRTIFR
jgi:hypothetical protein